MAKAKKITQRADQATLLKRDQVRVQRLEAQLQAQQIKAALSYYSAADVGRRNKDWRPNPASADAAILPDGAITCARARMTVANTSVGAAAVRSQKRNVVGRGIMVVPVAKGQDGKELTDANRIAGDLWMKWASSRNCDIECKRTYWQMQRMTVSEEFITGMSLMVWSYQPNPFSVGLRLQMFEYEQLNRDILSWEVKTPAGQIVTNEVRGGVEIDDNGAPVAYHFYKRNPNDWSYRGNYQTVRVEAHRVFPYFDAERVHQSVGISRFAPVLQDIRDQARNVNAVNSRQYMESCVGMGIKKSSPTIGTSPLTVPRRAGDTGTTASGMRTVDFTPGMVVELLPGEEIQTIIPQTPGNTFAPFTQMMHRMIGAGLGMSYGALTRENNANFSAARQDMLEDEREIGPQQDMLIDHQVMPVYELWYGLAVLEGRIPVDENEFVAERDRFVDAEYICPARPWIDPEKEVNAYEKALRLRIKTRKEIIAETGGQFKRIMHQIAMEREEAAEEGITFPEDVEQQAALPAPATNQVTGDANALPSDASNLRKQLSIAGAPNYRPLNDPEMNCGNCRFFKDGKCTAYDFVATASSVCDAFEVQPPTETTPAGASILPPGIPPGERGIDRTPDPAASDVRPL